MKIPQGNVLSLSFSRYLELLGSRLIWIASTALSHFLITLTIKTQGAPIVTNVSLPQFYLIFLFVDAFFQATNDIGSLKRLSFRLASLIIVVPVSSALYVSLSNWGSFLTNTVEVFLVSLLIVISRSTHAYVVGRFNYSKNTFAVFQVQLLVLVFVTSLFLLTYFSLLDNYTAVLLQFSAFGVVSFFFACPAKFETFRLVDIQLLAVVLLDFIKNQFVFISFSNQVEVVALAELLFVRALLSPVAMLFSVRRLSVEDKMIHEAGAPHYLTPVTLMIYTAFVLSLPVFFELLGMSWSDVLVWLIVLVIQDARAHLIRVGYAFSRIQKRLPIIASLISLMMTWVIFDFFDDFQFWKILIPMAIDFIVLLIAYWMSGSLERGSVSDDPC